MDINEVRLYVELYDNIPDCCTAAALIVLAGIQITLFTIPRLWEHSEYSDVNDEHKYIAHFTLNFPESNLSPAHTHHAADSVLGLYNFDIYIITSDILVENAYQCFHII